MIKRGRRARRRVVVENHCRSKIIKITTTTTTTILATTMMMMMLSTTFAVSSRRCSSCSSSSLRFRSNILRTHSAFATSRRSFGRPHHHHPSRRFVSDDNHDTVIRRRDRRLPFATTSTRRSTSSPPLHSSPSETDTIFALSSGGDFGTGAITSTAIAVIRISGPLAFPLLQSLLHPPHSPHPPPPLPRPRTATLRTIYDVTAPTPTPIDSAVILTFPSPKSYTGEDVVELHTHGSPSVIKDLFRCLPRLGREEGGVVRPAERGEFTKRAFDRGKLNLLQIESLADLITSETRLQRVQALKGLMGDDSSVESGRVYDDWRASLIKGLAHAEAVIDFGDDEDLDGGESDVWGAVGARMTHLRETMERAARRDGGELTRDGCRIAIVGPANAGKSSFLNLLAGREAAIVSPVAGTTRDVVEVAMDLGGLKCLVRDTAGVREEEDGDGGGVDEIEREGMKRSARVAKEAHVLICMLDATRVGEDFGGVQRLLLEGGMEGRTVLYVANKVDLLADDDDDDDDEQRQQQQQSSVSSTSSSASITIPPRHLFYNISCVTNHGVDDFLDQLTKTALARVSSSSSSPSDDSTTTNNNNNNIDALEDGALITRARHRRHVENAIAALKRFEIKSREGYASMDMAAEELRLAASELGRITGTVDVEDVLDVLFADFCIGK